MIKTEEKSKPMRKVIFLLLAVFILAGAAFQAFAGMMPPTTQSSETTISNS